MVSRVGPSRLPPPGACLPWIFIRVLGSALPNHADFFIGNFFTHALALSAVTEGNSKINVFLSPGFEPPNFRQLGRWNHSGVRLHTLILSTMVGSSWAVNRCSGGTFCAAHAIPNRFSSSAVGGCADGAPERAMGSTSIQELALTAAVSSQMGHPIFTQQSIILVALITTQNYDGVGSA